MPQDKPIVYFTRTITPETIVEAFARLGADLPGKVAVKLHSGEGGNQNYLGPDLVAPLIERVNGTVVECNTAYEGSRNTTEAHWHLMAEHGWTEHFDVDILDAEQPDLVLDVRDPLRIPKNYVGAHLANYDSLLVFSHFKGHAMGGYGGALKQLSIGIASSYGKANIHGAGNPDKMWSTEQDLFLESMVDAAGTVMERFDGKAAYVNVMKNISVDCDCDAHAKPPCMGDIGVLASLDPVAVDQACLDLVYGSDDPGRPELIERIESRHGLHTVEVAEERGLGSRTYELVEF